MDPISLIASAVVSTAMAGPLTASGPIGAEYLVEVPWQRTSLPQSDRKTRIESVVWTRLEPVELTPILTLADVFTVPNRPRNAPRYAIRILPWQGQFDLPIRATGPGANALLVPGIAGIRAPTQDYLAPEVFTVIDSPRCNATVYRSSD